MWANTIKWGGCEDDSGDFDGNGDANENGCVNKIVGILCESESVSHLVSRWLIISPFTWNIV